MNGTVLAFRLARRELRGGTRGFRVFIACLALGVGAIAGVGTLSHSVVAGLQGDGRVILGGDVDLRLHNRSPTTAHEAYLRDNSAALSKIVAMRAMARPQPANGRRSLVELKAVDALYPMVGGLVLDPPLALDTAFRREDGTWGAVADAHLLRRLGIGLGGRVRVGEATFQVRAAIVKEPDRVSSVFSLGPRLMIGAAALPGTQLLRPGSNFHHHTRLMLSPGTEAKSWIEDLKRAFPKAGWRIHGVDEAAPGVRRFIERMTLFLSFVGLTALLVGGIGVSTAVRAYLDGKTDTIATMKCLGAPAALVFHTYLLQVMALALAGIVIGLVLGVAVPGAGLAAAEAWLPVTPRIGVYPEPLAVGALFGALTALVFALWPLARARGIPAASLFRDRVAPARSPPRGIYLLGVVVGVLALATLTVVTTSDRGFAYWFVGGTLATLAALRAGAGGLMVATRRAPGLPGAEWRLAVSNIHRPGTATPSVVLSLGLGISVLVTVALVEGNLNRQIGERIPEQAPAFFFIDIQPYQVDAFDAAVTAVEGTHGLRRVPSLRGRIVGIAGVPVEKAKIAAGSEWAVRGDRALTYAAEKPRDTRVTAGEWWPADYRGPPLISLDASLAKGFGIDVGDTLTLNILGREVTATIASTREIDWRSLRFDFAIIFAPGTLEGAPHSYLAAVRAPPATEDAVEAAVSDRFSNISAVRVREALVAASRILAGIGIAVRAVAAIAITAGALVLAGAVAAGRQQRIYDAVVFKVLGATRAMVLKTYAMEYGIIGLATGTIAAAIGTLTAWAVVVFLLDTEWVFLAPTVAATVLGCVVLTVITGFTGTWRALGQKSAPYLRDE